MTGPSISQQRLEQIAIYRCCSFWEKGKGMCQSTVKTIIIFKTGILAGKPLFTHRMSCLEHELDIENDLLALYKTANARRTCYFRFLEAVCEVDRKSPQRPCPDESCGGKRHYNMNLVGEYLWESLKPTPTS
jgi:hypothetical protein